MSSMTPVGKVWTLILRTLLLMVLLVACVGEATLQYPPTIIKQPHSQHFVVAATQEENDNPLIIECEAEGRPLPRYRWMKNGKEFKWETNDGRISLHPGKGTLVFNSPKKEDSGYYQCFATNEMGTATSNGVFVRNAELNSFNVQDVLTFTVNEGEPTGLNCVPPDVYPKPSVSWMKEDDRGALRSINSTRMTVDPEGTLWFSNVTRSDQSDEFVYVCSVASAVVKEIKLGNRVKLQVHSTGAEEMQSRMEPKKQYVSRKNEVILKGETLRLWCIYGGTPVPEIRWRKYKSTTPSTLPSDRVEYENNGKTLAIRKVDYDDEGQYECEASNGVGAAKTYSINVRVQAIPFFEQEPESQNKTEGETVVFHCETLGRPPPRNFWTYNSKPIHDAPQNPQRIIEATKMTIFNLSSADTGIYGCNAKNEHGQVYKEAYVNVIDDIQSLTGQEVTIPCRTSGAPKLRITWMRDGHEVSGSRFHVTEEGDLVISDVSFSDAGNYICSTDNKFGIQEAQQSLVVRERRHITYGPEDDEVAAGDNATFRCNAVADSDLELSIGWLKDGERIDFTQDPHFILESDFSLTITNVTARDMAEYTCVASTELDNVTASAILFVIDVPNPPQIVKQVVCNDRTATIEWVPMGDNGAPILNYIIQYNTSFTPDTWENAFESVPASLTQFSISLSPWANYAFRVIARNKVGSSLPSDHSHLCMTFPDVPHANPEGVEGRGSSPDNLVVKWLPMPEIEHNGPGFKYRLLWKRDDIPGAQFQSVDILDWRQDHYMIPHQPTFKPYRIKVEALNARGQAIVRSYEVLGWSGEDVPSEAPQNLTLYELIDGRSAILSWAPVSNSSVNGHFKGYKVQTWTEEEGEDKAREIRMEISYTRNNDPVALVRSFVPYAKNFVRVLVVNGAYDGPPSESINFNTPEGRPGPVDSVDAIPMGSSAFYLMWKKPKHPNGILWGYNIFYQEVDGTRLGTLYEMDPPIDDDRVTNAKLAGLKPATKYRIIIKARTAVGMGPGYYIEATTQGIRTSTPPGKPNFLWSNTWTRRGYQAIKVTWIPNRETNPGSHFFVKYKVSGERMYTNSKPELYNDFKVFERYISFEANRTYEVCIVAVDGEFQTESDVKEIDTQETYDSYGNVRDPADGFTSVGTSPAKIRALPGDIKSVTGQEVTMICRVLGDPKPKITWLRNGNEMTGDRFHVTEEGNLIISDVSSSDDGTYICLAENKFGMQKAQGLLVVKDRTRITDVPVDYEVVPGQNATFTCNAVADSNLKLSIGWLKDGEHIDFIQDPHFMQQSDFSLIVTEATLLDSGVYTCVASTGLDNVTASASLIVQEIRGPSDVQSVTGQEVTLNCELHGITDGSTFTWSKDEQGLTGDRFHVTEEGDLVISDVSFIDAGIYTCVMENESEQQHSKRPLLVKESTRITAEPVNYEVAAGENAVFRCNAVADNDLELSIGWLKDGERIDFTQDPHFAQQSDFSLTVTEATAHDSGVYTCVASTELDSVSASAYLFVIDVPDPPQIGRVTCTGRDATLRWMPQGDNGGQILDYVIQFNTSFTPDTWENAFDSVPAIATEFSVFLSPWANYTFRIIAQNKVGRSLPSHLTHMCTTPPNVPDKNPDEVEGRGSNPDNLVIKWLPMPEIEHNGPGFKYRLYWKRDDIPDAQFQSVDILDWRQDHYVIPHQPTFKPYRIKVEALNARGQANVRSYEVLGWSGEDVPTEAPQNLRLVKIHDATSAIFAWDPVSESSIRGHFRGYKIQTWADDGERLNKNIRDIIVQNDGESSALVRSFAPYTTNFVQVVAFNGAYDSRPSNVIVFNTPEGKPGPVESLDAVPLGSSAFYLIWKKPKHRNGILLGYRIFYQEVMGIRLSEMRERRVPITDPHLTRAKLASLKPATKYRITIRAHTRVGMGSSYYIERTTRSTTTPDKPNFIWEHYRTSTNTPALKITWTPNIENNPGSYFFVRYRPKLDSESIYQDTKPEMYEDFIIVEDLQPDQTYQVLVVAVDGEFQTESDVEEIDIFF